MTSIVLVAARTYQLWKAGPWELPTAGKAKETPPAQKKSDESAQVQVVNTRNIIEKNLFDPDRGATRVTEAKAAQEAAAMQKIRSMVLLGTAILGNSSYAIMQEPSEARAPAKPGATGQTRYKLGDTLEGFRITEIRDKSVVFTKGASKVEVSIDFFRPGSEPAPAAPAAPRQPVGPRIPPRAAIPGAPQGAQPENPGGGGRSVLRGERALQPPQQPAGRPGQRVPPSQEGNPPAGGQ